MIPAAFRQHFRALTGVSPLQDENDAQNHVVHEFGHPSNSSADAKALNGKATLYLSPSPCAAFRIQWGNNLGRSPNGIGVDDADARDRPRQ